MVKESNTIAAEANSEHSSLNPGIIATLFVALFIASLVPVTLLVSETHFPSPLQPPGEVVAYFQAETIKVRICAFLQICSAICLVIFTALMVSRMWYHGANTASVMIALLGGVATSFFVALSALIQWTLTQPGVADNASVILALHYLLFATGGPGFSVLFGLLVAGISISAGAMRLLPRWLVVFGVILGIIGELSILSLVIPGALFLIPLTRFPGFVWLIAAGFKLHAAHPQPPNKSFERTAR